jgi:hypothetical protein
MVTPLRLTMPIPQLSIVHAQFQVKYDIRTKRLDRIHWVGKSPVVHQHLVLHTPLRKSQAGPLLVPDFM